MILCDVNVLVHACAPRSSEHKKLHALVEDLLQSKEQFALHGPILAAVLRICTHPKIFKPPATPESVFKFLEPLRQSSKAVFLDPGKAHWDIFQQLVIDLKIRGADVTDAWFAALAIEHDVEWWTADTGFDRFPGLRVRRVL